MISMMLGMFGWPALILSVLAAIALCIHVVRTGREMYWLWIILVFQPLGGLVYFIAIVLPELTGGSTARRISRAARETLDPDRDYRAAKAACEDSPTVSNRMRLASAAATLGRHEEAERLYREAMAGIHADDPALLLGRARALVELGRFDDALGVLKVLEDQGETAHTPQAMLALARAYEGLGRDAEAGEAYAWAAERLPGLEGMARWAAYLARTGRAAEARETLVEIEKRAERATAHFRKEARFWRDFAAQRVG